MDGWVTQTLPLAQEFQPGQGLGWEGDVAALGPAVQSGTGQGPSTQHPPCCSQLPCPTPPEAFQPLTAGPKPRKYGNMHLNCLEEKVTACVRAPTMAFCPGDNSSCKEQRRHLFSGTTEHIICQLQINRYSQTRPVIKGCLNHLPYFL